MSYDPTVPTGPQFFSASQPIIQGNFNKANSDFGVDHKPFTTGVGAGEGEHVKVTFNNVQAVPPVTFVAPKGELFTQASTGPNVFSDLYWGAKGSTTPGANPVPLAKLTGGGITTGAWGTFNAAVAASITILHGYNVTASGVAGGFGVNLTINFPRPFTDNNYFIIINPGAVATKSNTGFTTSVGLGAFFQFLCFGTLQ